MELQEFALFRATPIERGPAGSKLIAWAVNVAGVYGGISAAAYLVGLGLKIGMS